MNTELPELRRCCCIPLKYGLIASGYIKLVLSLLSIIYGLYFVSFFQYPEISIPEGLGLIDIWELLLDVNFLLPSKFIKDFSSLLIILLMLLFLVLDVCFTVIFLIGGHRKSTQLLFLNCVWSMVVVCIYTATLTWVMVWDFYHIARLITSESSATMEFLLIVLIRLLIGFFLFGFQIYLVLLIRSEINKLNKNSKMADQVTAENVINEQNGMDNQIKETN